MVATQIITIEPSGAISGLERKDGMDFKCMGRADVNRASEILWDSDNQMWYVSFLSARDAVSADTLTEAMFRMSGADRLDFQEPLYIRTRKSADKDERISVVFFNSYRDAVEAEICVLDYFRKSGKF